MIRQSAIRQFACMIEACMIRQSVETAPRESESVTLDKRFTQFTRDSLSSRQQVDSSKSKGLSAHGLIFSSDRSQGLRLRLRPFSGGNLVASHEQRGDSGRGTFGIIWVIESAFLSPACSTETSSGVKSSEAANERHTATSRRLQ